MAEFRIAHMYPDLMNLYGDRGNLLCLQKRIEWYGHNCRIININLEDRPDFDNIDMLFMGGGSDREQGLVYNDLLTKAEILQEKIEEGLPVLCVCGAYQLLGKSYRSYDGKDMKGLSFFDFHTVGEKKRLIGNILIETNISGENTTAVGFENHGGRTYFDDEKIEAFGTVVKGNGNNGEDGKEGIKYYNLIGTYLHGPLLPKNPIVADFFIKKMAERGEIEINGSVDNTIENTAHEQVIKKIMAK